MDSASVVLNLAATPIKSLVSAGLAEQVHVVDSSRGLYQIPDHLHQPVAKYLAEWERKRTELETEWERKRIRGTLDSMDSHGLEFLQLFSQAAPERLGYEHPRLSAAVHAAGRELDQTGVLEMIPVPTRTPGRVLHLQEKFTVPDANVDLVEAAVRAKLIRPSVVIDLHNVDAGVNGGGARGNSG